MVLSTLGVLSVIGGGVIVAEIIRARYSIRLGGVIAIPLIALLTLVNPWALPVYVIGTALLFAVATRFHKRTLIYGRVLLSTTLVMAMGYGIAVYAVTGFAGAEFFTGFELFLTSLFAGIGAYSLHMVAPVNRPPAVKLNAGLFATVFFLCQLILQPPITAFVIAYLGSCLAVMVLAGSTLLRLEQRIKPLEEHHTGVIQ